MTLSAESIARSLDKGRRIRTDHYTACCPANDDKRPCLSITQASDKILVYCPAKYRQCSVVGDLALRINVAGRRSI